MHARIALFTWLGLAVLPVPAAACSFAFTEMPYSLAHYVFYGKVLEYISHRMEACGRDPRRSRDQCPAAWGWKLAVIEPVRLPKPLTQVEYFEYTVDAACGPLPLGEAHVRRVPVGSLVTLVARPHWSSDPLAPSPRLSSVTPIGSQMAVLPPGADPRALVRESVKASELACLPENRWPDARLAFEYWRERDAVRQETSPRRKFERLLKLMSAFDAGFFARSEQPTMHEKVVREELPVDLLDEFYARLPALREAAHAGCPRN